MIYTHSAKVCLGTEPCDLRKSFDSLSVIVSEQLKDDPLSRKIFVFLGLAQGRFCRSQGLKTKSTKLALNPEPLEILLNSIDLKDGLQRVWYETLLTQEATST